MKIFWGGGGGGGAPPPGPRIPLDMLTIIYTYFAPPPTHTLFLTFLPLCRPHVYVLWEQENIMEKAVAAMSVRCAAELPKVNTLCGRVELYTKPGTHG